MPTRLSRGQRVGDRYLLSEELGGSEHGVTWKAIDERLDRGVALRIFASGIDRAELTQRAGVAASLTHPRVVRVFDTGSDGARFFTVSELLPTSLASVRLPLSPANSLNTATDVAEALQYAHERGVVHGNLHEGNVLLSESGAKVGDFALSVAPRTNKREDDLRALGAMMRRVSPTSTDPDDPYVQVVDALRTGAYNSATDVLNDFRALRPVASVRQEARGGSSRRVWPVFVIAILIAVAAFGATRLGRRGGEPDFVAGGHIKGTPLRVLTPSDYDPPPGDGSESPGTVHFIHDGQSTTYWTTERYTTSANFNGRKSGVGVVFDMGGAVNVGQAEVLFAGSPCPFELRFADTRAASIDGWQTATVVPPSKLAQSTAVQFSPHTARYWLLWITSLSRSTSGSAFTCAVAEANLYAP